MSDVLANVGAVFQLSIVLLVLSIGMHASWSDVTYMFRHPGQFARSVVARNALMPVIAAAIVLTFDLAPPVKAALFAVSIAAVPPFLPVTLLKAGGRVPYVIGLLTSQSLLAVVFIPITIAVFNALMDTHAHFASRQIWTVVARLTLLPLLAGVAVHRFAPAYAARIARATHRLALGLLVLSILLVLPGMWRTWAVLIGNGTLAAIVLIVAAGIGIGHVLGGPRHEDRTSLALATVSSNPGLAVAVLSTNVPSLQRPATAAVLLYLVVQLIVAWPYTRARRAPSEVGLYRIAERRSMRRPGPDRRRVVG